MKFSFYDKHLDNLATLFGYEPYELPVTVSFNSDRRLSIMSKDNVTIAYALYRLSTKGQVDKVKDDISHAERSLP